ncbi:hypothetical protein RND81_06G169400 [Saponaria officinalis]|uniref:Oberon PHD finger domain-containing protein n=1 Tax=Saponaria officinalis TaxID=3572 RepID=A0AAW1KAY6_SAPOF
MDSTFEGAVIDPVKCSKLSMETRKEIVYELSKWSHGAAEVLQTWSRQDILQILCAEMGKERKYTGLTKLKMIELLLKVVSEKSVVCEQQSSPLASQKSSKRPRKPENLSHLLESASATNISALNVERDSVTETYCRNAACRARLNNEDVFCKRCTCCVCHKFDDNKDPSLWLTCSSEPPFPGNSCNMSCHLECAVEHARSGIARNRLVAKLDGEFYCISCGKMNDLMRCWRKQVNVAKETRRVDILCYRISLSKKLLSGTQKYQTLSKIVDDAVRLLEAEVGTLSGGPVKMGSRGIVNRLSSGQEVQRLCASALESFDSITCHTPSHQDSRTTLPNICSSNDITNWSSLSVPSSVEDETTTITTRCDLIDTGTEDCFGYYKTQNKMVDLNSSNQPLNSTNVVHDSNPSCGSDEEDATGKPESVNGQTILPITPSRKESLKDGITKKRRSKCARKGQDNNLRTEKHAETKDEERVADGPAVGNLEFCINTVRWLESEGHIDESFRQKFLSWYSIRATPQESRIVKAFVDTLIDDPASLAEQLVDTFSEIVSSKRSSDVPRGFCLKLWH